MQRLFLFFLFPFIFTLTSSRCYKEDTGIIDKYYYYHDSGNIVFRINFNSNEIDDVNKYKWELKIWNENDNLVFISDGIITGSPCSSPQLITWTKTDNRGNRVRDTVFKAVYQIDLELDENDRPMSGTYSTSLRGYVY